MRRVKNCESQKIAKKRHTKRKGGHTVNIPWKYRFSHNGAKINSHVVKMMLIKDLKSKFQLVWIWRKKLLPK